MRLTGTRTRTVYADSYSSGEREKASAKQWAAAVSDLRSLKVIVCAQINFSLTREHAGLDFLHCSIDSQSQ